MAAAPPYPGHGMFLPYLINRTTTLINARLQTVLEPQGLTLTHWRVLAFLTTVDDGLTLGALGDATLTEQSTLSRSLKGLEGRSLVERRACTADSRAVQIRITRQGKRLFQTLLKSVLALEAELLQGVSLEETELMRSVMLRIIANAPER